MIVQRVEELPDDGELGVIYIIEPGSTSWTWDPIEEEFVLFESRAPGTIQYPQVFGDVEEGSDSGGSVIVTPP